jgi:excisionase family DNA binding protein
MTATITPRQTARELGVSLHHVYDLLWSGRFPGAKKNGKRWSIPVSDVKARLEVGNDEVTR